MEKHQIFYSSSQAEGASRSSTCATEHAIADHIDACGCLFLKLITVLKDPAPLGRGANKDKIQDEFEWFKICAGHVGAHQKGRLSLESRMGDSEWNYDKEKIIELLKDLQRHLIESEFSFRLVKTECFC